MPSDFNYKMTDREYEKMTMLKKTNKTEKKSLDEKDVVESNDEQNEADDEDNMVENEDYAESDDSIVDPP